MKNIRSTTITMLALSLAVGLAGCGGGAKPASRASALSGGDRAFLAFAACMRGHGVHMGDPFHRTGHAGLTLDLPTKMPATIRAYASCNHLIASVLAMKEAGAAARQNAMSYRQRRVRQLGLLHYARCMRAHAIPMLDPDANGNLNLGNVPGAADVGRYSPLFRRADHACRGLLPAGIGDNGTGP